jgi:hypothetical protein
MVYGRSFLTLALVEGEWSASGHDRLTPRDTVTNIHQTGRLPDWTQISVHNVLFADTITLRVVGGFRRFEATQHYSFHLQG